MKIGSLLYLKPRLLRITIVFTLVVMVIGDIYGDDLFRFGTPFIQHFTKKDYKAGNQNWSITQDEDGFIYAGNSNGLLQFDGYRWSKFNLPSATIVRSVFAYKNRIYCGSLGELGYWEKDENFNLHYTSLTHLIKDHEFGDEEIWWITQIDGNIIFQSFSTTFLYDGRSIETILTGQGVIFPPFVVKDRLFIQVLSRGLYEIADRRGTLMPGSEFFIDKRINVMLPFSNSANILIGTEEDGFYELIDEHFESWEISKNSSIMRDQINRGIKISDDLFAVGTLLGGIYILNEQGEVLNQINKKSGLNNNTVLSFMLDKNSNLWVGLDNGIDLIKVNSPIYYKTDVSGNIGSVYTAVIYQDDLYLGTNRGVFYTKFDRQSNRSDQDFSIIPGSQGQVWSLAVIDDHLFCGHNTSTFLIQDYQLNKISDIAGGYEIKQYPYNDNRLFQGSYNGLSVYEQANGNWRFSHTIPNFQKLSKIIEFERENVLWVSHTHRGLYRLEFNHDLTEISEIREFAQGSKTYVNKLNNKLVVSSDSGFLYYDDIQNSFFPLSEINNELGKFSINAHIISAGKDNYWIFKDGDCARVVMDENSVSELDDNVLNDLNEFLIPGFENIYVIDSAYTLIFLDNGYAIYDNAWKDKAADYQPNVLVRELKFQTHLGEIYQEKIDPEGIPFRFNNINLKISYPEFAREAELIHKLEGYDDRWMKSIVHGEISYQNLPFGEYTIHVMPENGSPSEEFAIGFVINPPWFKSTSARVLYILIALLLLGIAVVLNRRKINRIHKKHELERKQLLEKEARENEKKLIEVRNENLRNEIKLRNSRLAKSTFSLIHKNNTLIAVKEELTKIKEELGVRFPSKHFNRLIRNIDQDLTSDKDWRMFEQSFSEVHENFLHKIKEKHPELTPADIQLCAYLKMNLSSKEIATLLNITVRGVEIRRYRLRKKLHMDHDTNLVEYIMGY